MARSYFHSRNLSSTCCVLYDCMYATIKDKSAHSKALTILPVNIVSKIFVKVSVKRTGGRFETLFLLTLPLSIGENNAIFALSGNSPDERHLFIVSDSERTFAFGGD